MKKTKHNGIISLWKFIFAIVIAIYHGNALYTDSAVHLFKGGYIAVEFFFIVSGFYFAKGVLKEKYNQKTIGKETVKYIWDKYKRFLPYLLISCVGFTILAEILNPNFKTAQIFNTIYNILLLKQFGFNSPVHPSAVWYLSVMLISMAILYPIVKKHKENFICIFSPVIAILIMGYLAHSFNSINQSYLTWNKIISTGTLRGFAEINLGMFIYYIHTVLKDIKYTKFCRFILTMIGELNLVFILCLVSLSSHFISYDYAMLAFITISVLIMTSGKTLEYNILSNKFTRYLEKLSLPIFINHQIFYYVVVMLKILENSNPLYRILAYLIPTIIFSIIELFIIERIDYNRIKKIFINN